MWGATTPFTVAVRLHGCKQTPVGDAPNDVWVIAFDGGVDRGSGFLNISGDTHILGSAIDPFERSNEDSRLSDVFQRRAE